MDLLADDYCEKDINGLYVVKQEYRDRTVSDLYTISTEPTTPTKKSKYNYGRWTDEEHGLFLEALLIYGKDWDKIEEHIGTRDAAHARSHAQKFFLKLVKWLEDGEGLEENEI